MASRRTLAVTLVTVVTLGAACSSTGSGASSATTATAPATQTTQRPTVDAPAAAPVGPSPVHLVHGIALHVPRPSGLIAAFGDLWAQSGPSALWKIAPSGRVLAQLSDVSHNPLGPIGGANQGYETLAAGFGSIWTLMPKEVLRIDPMTDRVIARIEVPASGGNQTLVVGLGGVWVANNEADLLRIDPKTNTTTFRTSVGTTPVAITPAGGRIWIPLESEAGGLYSFDPGTSKVIEEPRTQDNGAFILGAFNQVWVAQGNQISWIDPDNGRQKLVTTEPQSVHIKGVAAGLGKVFFNGGRLIVLDPRNHRVHVLPGVSLPLGNAGITVLGHHVWMVDTVKHRIVRINVCAEIRCP